MKRVVSRFERPSSSLEMKALLGRTRKVLWLALVIAMGIHLSLTSIRVFEAEQSAVKPLTTKFMKREPRLTKPLELKKRPQPKRRAMQRRMVAIKAKVDRQRISSSVRTADVVRRLARPEVQVERFTSLGATHFEPQAVAEAITGSKEAKQTMDMSLELLDIHALDTGRYHAMVIQDPVDKRNIKGFCHLAVVYVPRLYIISLKPGTGDGQTWFETGPVAAIRNLSRALNQYTQIRADVNQRLGLGSAELYRTPWIYFYSYAAPYEFSDYELDRLGKYMMGGGLLLVDTHPTPVYNTIECHKRNIVASLKSQGIIASPDKLPNNHPIYHCFFDFDGPPIGMDGSNINHTGGPSYFIRDYLEGLVVDGRLVAILTDKGYTASWTWWTPGLDATRQFQFGVNTIVFALTQEGSITHQVMDNVAY